MLHLWVGCRYTTPSTPALTWQWPRRRRSTGAIPTGMLLAAQARHPCCRSTPPYSLPQYPGQRDSPLTPAVLLLRQLQGRRHLPDCRCLPGPPEGPLPAVRLCAPVVRRPSCTPCAACPLGRRGAAMALLLRLQGLACAPGTRSPGLVPRPCVHIIIIVILGSRRQHVPRSALSEDGGAPWHTPRRVSCPQCCLVLYCAALASNAPSPGNSSVRLLLDGRQAEVSRM